MGLKPRKPRTVFVQARPKITAKPCAAKKLWDWWPKDERGDLAWVTIDPTNRFSWTIVPSTAFAVPKDQAENVATDFVEQSLPYLYETRIVDAYRTN